MKKTGMVLIIFLLALIPAACEKQPVNTEHFTTPYQWQKAEAADCGIDTSLLKQGIAATNSLGYVKSLLLIKDGFLVSENYFHGYGKYDSHIIHSVSKSFISALVGIALERGDIPGLDKKMMDYFPEYDNSNLDPRVRDITIEHLLTMKAGFDTDRNVYMYIYNSSNWVRTTINLQLISDPGEAFHYCTFETHLLSAILTKACGVDTRWYAETYLLNPLGITCDAWTVGPDGYYFGGNNMYFTTRDLARFGLLYLRQGEINGKQILDQDWVDESLSFHAGGDWSSWGPIDHMGYGYLWWLGTIDNHSIRLALGHAGQIILLVPALDLVVAANSETVDNWDIADQQERGVLQTIADYIIPAVNN